MPPRFSQRQQADVRVLQPRMLAFCACAAAICTAMLARVDWGAEARKAQEAAARAAAELAAAAAVAASAAEEASAADEEEAADRVPVLTPAPAAPPGASMPASAFGALPCYPAAARTGRAEDGMSLALRCAAASQLCSATAVSHAIVTAVPSMPSQHGAEAAQAFGGVHLQ